MADPYKIVAEPIGSSDDKKTDSGIVIYLVHPASRVRKEVSRVGFVRRNSKNKETDFETQLQAELDRARTAVRMLNEQFDGSGELL